MFGTFVEEREGEAIVYGVRKPLQSFNPLWGNLHYYFDLLQEARNAQGWRAKLDVWLAPPGGWRDGAIEHFEPAGFARYSRPTPTAVRWYAALQFALLVPLVSHFLAVAPISLRIAVFLAMLASALWLARMPLVVAIAQQDQPTKLPSKLDKQEGMVA